MSSSLLATKTHIPSTPAALVNRSRLMTRLEVARRNHHRLILVSAPAGFGKSTLLIEWARQAGTQLAWVSLDAQDNDPPRFWAYFVSALQTCAPGFGQALFDRLVSAQPPPEGEIVAELVNRLATLPNELILVLDDYHVINHASIHQQIVELIEHAPQNFLLVIATRSDPPLPLHRWRARACLAEIRSADLRFTTQEMQLFLNERMGLSLAQPDIARLEERTEGWAVGLQLAALSLQGRADPAAFIQRFSGSHHYVLEYLTNEVLAIQPVEVQEFLLQTSLLDRFCASLCDTVRGKADSSAVLERLLQANLFLIPLDDEHIWFRYHHLFAELLRLRLSQQYADQVAALHQRAAGWYDQTGLIDESLAHALAAKDFQFAGDLVNRSWRLALHQGRLRESRRWIEALPKELLASHPLLSAAYAWNLYLLGQNNAAEPLIETTNRLLVEWEAQGKLPHDDPEYTTLPGQMLALQAMISSRKLDFRAAVEQAQRAIHLIPPDDRLALGPAWLSLSNSQRELGQFEECVISYRQTIPLLKASRNPMAWAVAVYFLGRVLQIQGRLREAFELFETAIEESLHEGTEIPSAYGILQVGLGDLSYEWNDLSAAQAYLAKGWAQDKQSGYVDMLRFGSILGSRLLRANGDLQGAVSLLLEARHKAGAPNAEAEISAWLLRYQAETGASVPLKEWEQQHHWDVDWGYTNGNEAFAVMRAWLTADRWMDALELAEHLEKIAQGTKSTGWQIEACLIQALALWLGQKKAQAVETGLQCLSQAEEHGYFRLLVDEGEAARALLQACRQSDGLEPRIKAYIDRLLNAFPHPKEAISASSGPAAVPLTEREMEVLRWMAEGLTNPEIAERLVVSAGTVKTHVSHIYDKFDTNSRAETVLKAKALHLI